jgi:hypothetical protein
MATKNKPKESAGRSCILTDRWKGYVTNMQDVKSLPSCTYDVAPYATVYADICKLPSSNKSLDPHIRASFRVVKSYTIQTSNAQREGMTSKASIQLLRLAGVMLAQISNRCSEAYDTAWIRHLTRIVEGVTTQMKITLSQHSKDMASAAEWRKMVTWACIFTQSLIVDQLRFGSWTMASLNAFSAWIDTFAQYSTKCVTLCHITTMVTQLHTCCEILQCNIIKAIRTIKPRCTEFVDQRCHACVSYIETPRTQDYSAKFDCRFQRGNLVVSCRHTRNQHNSYSTGLGSQAITPMLDHCGAHRRGLVLPPAAFWKTMHRHTIIVLHMLTKVCTARNSSQLLRNQIAQALRTTSRLGSDPKQDLSRQFQVTYMPVLEMFGTSVSTSHQAQLAMVDLLRITEPHISDYHESGMVGDNVRAVVWYLVAMVIPVLNHANMWHEQCKKYYMHCLSKIETCATQQEVQTRGLLSESHFVCDETETSDDEDEDTTYNVSPASAIESMRRTGLWQDRNTMNKAQHRFRCTTCVVCNSASSSSTNNAQYLGVVTDLYTGASDVVAICSMRCMKLHCAATVGAPLQLTADNVVAAAATALCGGG